MGNQKENREKKRVKRNQRQQKKEEKVQRQYAKKRSFWQVFRGNMVIILPIAFVLLLAASFFATEVLRYYKQIEPDYLEISYDGTINRYATGEFDQNQLINRLRQGFSMPIDNETCAIGIYDEEGNTFLSTERSAYLYLKNLEEDQGYVYCCDLQWIPNQYVLTDEDNQDKNNRPEMSYTIYFKDVYIKDGKFLPGVAVIEKNEDGTQSTEDWTPDHVDGYTHRIIENTWNMEFGCFLNVGCSTEMLKLLETEDAKQVLEESGSSVENNSFWSDSYYYDSRNVRIDNKDYTVLYALKYNMWKEYGLLYVIAWIVGSLLAILLSWFLSYNFYKSYKARNMMEQYRRDTTNAMAHDLKSPLMVISGYAENLKEDVHTEKRDYYAEAIISNVNYMNGIISKILELAKVENIDTNLKKERIDLNILSKKVLEHYKILFEKKDIFLEVRGAAFVVGDLQLVERVLDNLIFNASTYTPIQGKITISLSEKMFQITNTCVERPTDKLENLWKPFVRGNEARTLDMNAGTGMGLAIVKEILELHEFDYCLNYEADEFVVTFTWKNK